MEVGGPNDDDEEGVSAKEKILFKEFVKVRSREISFVIRKANSQVEECILNLYFFAFKRSRAYPTAPYSMIQRLQRAFQLEMKMNRPYPMGAKLKMKIWKWKKMS